MLNKYFDNIFCINLDSRKDRWEQCLIEFEKLGISNTVKRFSGIQMDPGIAGCTKSHIELIKYAKQQNFNNILIFEDDFKIIHSEFNDVLSKSFDQLNSNNLEYDLLYLGGNIKDPNLNKLIDNNLALLKYCKTTHAYAVNSRIFDFILDNFKNVNWLNNNNWDTSNNNRLTIDVWYCNNIQVLGNSYGVFPCLIDQRSGYSDNTNSYMNYDLSYIYNNTLFNL